MADDLKYGRVVTERKALPEDEPVFILRAQDLCALPAILSYMQQCEEEGAPSEHLSSVQNAMERFGNFHREHPDRVKVPD